MRIRVSVNGATATGLKLPVEERHQEQRLPLSISFAPAFTLVETKLKKLSQLIRPDGQSTQALKFKLLCTPINQALHRKFAEFSKGE